jgi:hypothetical protein
VHDLIAALVDKSLVVLEPEVLGRARYRMLDTIREYAAARLADTGESAQLQLLLRDYTLLTAEQNLAIGMAQVPVPWSDRVDCSRRYIVDADDQPRPGDPPKILSQPAGIAPDLGQRNRVYLVTAVLPTPRIQYAGRPVRSTRRTPAAHGP